MTPLSKPVTRDTLTDHYMNGRIVVKLAREGIYLKTRGQRWSSAVLLPWELTYQRAVKEKLAAEQAAKKKQRKLNRAARRRAA